MSIVQRSGRDRRQAINDLDYFSRKWVERRSYEDRRKAPEATQSPSILGSQKHQKLVNSLIKTAIALLMAIAAYLAWQIVQKI